jgi:amino acid adenylation domain-containing protein
MTRSLRDSGGNDTWDGHDPGAAAPGRGAAQVVAEVEARGPERPVVDRYPLTPLQEGMLFTALAAPDTGVDVVQVVCTLSERVDTERLREAWRRAAARHDVLRTAFRWADVPTPVQEVHAAASVDLHEVDYRGAAPGEAAAHLHAFLAADRGRGVDLSAAPAVRLALLTFGERDHRLVWTVHHAMAELRSVVLVLDEVFAFYDAGDSERTHRPPPFREFVEWLAAQPEAPEAEFWREALDGARVPTPLPGVGAASPEEGTDAGYGERTLCIPPETTAALLAAVPGVRLNTLIPAAWAFVLGRSTDEDDVVFGVVRGLHLLAFPGAEDIVGPLINTIPLRVRLRDDLPLGDWLRAVRAAGAALLGHEHASLAQIQAWAGLPGRTPLFHTLVNYQPAPVDALLRARGGRWAQRPVEIHRRPAHPLALAAYGEDSLLLRVDFDRAFVSEQTAGRMLERVARFLETVAEAPGRRLSEVSLLSEAERRQVLVEWSAAAAPPPDDRCVHALFAEQAARTPEAVALVCGERRVSYAELSARTERMAGRLRGMGVGGERRVALFMERGVDLVVAMLAVLRAGGCYVPIDPEHPSERVAWLLRDSGAAVVLTQAGLRGRLPASGARVLEVDGRLEGSVEEPDAAPMAVDPARLAYVIYTSGSTGTPKGVGIPHRALARHMGWMQRVHPLAADDRVLQKTSVSFDASVWEFYAPLLAGATLVLAPPGVQRDPAALARTAARERITILQVVPSLLGALLESGALGGCTSLRRLFCGGEALPAAMAARARAMLDAEVVNLYGPTEVCIDSVTHSYAGDDTGATVPIGRPVDHVRARVLDRWGHPVPVEVPGELYLGGAQLARGYLGRPALTAERFVPDPFADEAGARLYRTGDRVRWLATGELEFLGRMDQQVKIRGFRIEPGEVEAALLALPAVAEAAVEVREDAGERRLVGYVVPADADASEERMKEALRDALLARLPEYMVPSAFVVLDALPLLPNGKVDRRALPAPEWGSAGGARVAPRTPVEELLAGIWAEVLGRDAVGAAEDFFALGGHSLLAMRVLLRVERSFGVDLPVRTIFEAPTVAALARRVEAARQGGEVRDRMPLRPAERGSEAALSFAQQRLWFVDQMEGAGAAYIVPREMRLHGRLDVMALRRALQEIVRRHEALRTVFRAREPEPVQVVLPPAPLDLPLHDLSGLPADDRDDALRVLVRDEVRRPFDLVAGPLFRAMLARLDGDEHALLWNMHHIVGDGWSLDVFHRELGALYDAFARGEPSPLAELPVQYADYALWQRAWLRGEVLERQLAWWKAHLAGAPTLLELPTDRPRSAVRTWRGARQPFNLDDGLRRRLEAVARGEGATLFMVLLAAWQVLLGKYAGTDDVVVGSPIAGRTRAETEGLIGFFVNTLALRADLSGDPRFGELVGRVREVTLGAYEHQELPFAKLVEELEVERSLGHSPLVQVMFALHNGPAEGLRLAGVETQAREVVLETAKFDLTLSLEAQQEGLEGRIAYSTELFDAATITRLGKHYRTLLEEIAANPGRRLSELSLLGEAERRQVLVDWNAAGAPPLPPDRCVHEHFEAQARLHPHAPAVSWTGGELTCAELDRRANRLAHALRARGVGPEARVGILLERGPELVVALLATLKAGGAYVPLDPAYPAERLRFMAADAGVELILTQTAFWTRHADLAAQSPRVLLLDEERADIERHPDDGAPASGVGPEHLAYVIYTSGSTGTPKGSMVPHRSIPGYLDRYADLPDDTPERWLQYSALAWDALTLELWSPLLRGGCCVLYPAGETGVGVDTLGRAIREGEVTSLWMTAALFNLVVDTAPETLAPLRLLLVGGEQLSVPHVRRAREMLPQLRLVNGYGPSECTVFSTIHPIERGRELADVSSVPIGRPVGDRRCYVLDASLQPVPVGIPGELYVGGPAVARGYLGRPALTAERFVPDPFSGEIGVRLYRTGDRVRWLASGELEFLGRIDQQVKIRGFRIEPGEVEAALLALPDVAEAVVEVREDTGEKRLVGYVVPADADAPEVRMKEALREALLARLPEYMVPAAFVMLDALPLTSHGKVDRRALPAPEWGGAGEGRLAPRTPVEELLAGIWAEVLGREAVGVEEDFFALGGHSLLAMRVLLRVERSFGVDLPVRAIFEAPTVAALARRIEAARQGGEARERVPLRPAERGSEAALSFAQQRLWFVDQMEGAGAAYHVPGAVRLRGRLDARALRRALQEIVRRHEALRTVFRVRDPEPLQVVLPPEPLHLPLHDLSALPAPEREAALRERVREEARRPFDLAAGPLFQAVLVRLGEEEHALLVSMHHIVSDGWSLGVLHHELEVLYDAFSRGEPSPLAELPVQYADYALWQRAWLKGEVLDRQLAWWTAQLSGAPVLLELPTDRPRPAVQTYRGARQPFHLDDELRRRLEAVARGEGATLFMVLLAAFQVLLGKYAGTHDVVVGSPIAGRTRAETEGLIGFFVNTLALRADLSADPDFRGLLAQVRERTLGAHEHQDLPFEKLVEELGIERSLSHTPLVQAVFALQSGSADGLRLAGLETETLEVEQETAKFDLTLSLQAREHGLEGRIAYGTDLFDAATIARLVAHYRTLLEGIAADPGRRLSELSLLGAGERRQLLVDWYAAGAPLPVDRCVHEIFQAQAGRTPAAVAVVHGGEQITYADLDRRANRLAHALRARGVGPEARVGLLLERGPELVVALLATLKAGGAYVPLDPAYPSERLRFMAADAGVELILTQTPFWRNHAAELGAQGPRVLLLDEDRADIERHPAGVPPASGVGPEHLAYVIYTSGSTGTPKGTMVPHRSIPGYLDRYADLPSGTPERWLQYSALAWDVLTLELWSPLLRGGCCVLYPPGEAGVSVDSLGRAIREGNVTSLWMTAALFNLVVDTAPETLAPLRLLLVGGEQLSVPHVRRAREAFPELRLVNGYGPSECTVFSTIHPITSAGALDDLPSVPIGRPVGDRRCYVLDPSLRPVPVGIPGELYVGGPAVARGYLGRPALTAERFVPDPFAEAAGARLYRTGDRVRWLASGELEFLGRIDQQVKIRGFRIEPGEIEAALLALPAVAEAVVEVREDAGEKRLVGYVVPVDPALTPGTVREALRARLPEYMVPSAFVVLEAIPLTPRGKVDRRALPAPGLGSGEGERVAPRTSTEELLAGIWAEVLGRDAVGVEEDFFALGGHSLLATLVLLRVQRSFAVELPLRTIFERTTVAGLAEEIDTRRSRGAGPEAVPLVRASRQAYRADLSTLSSD